MKRKRIKYLRILQSVFNLWFSHDWPYFICRILFYSFFFIRKITKNYESLKCSYLNIDIKNKIHFVRCSFAVYFWLFLILFQFGLRVKFKSNRVHDVMVYSVLCVKTWLTFIFFISEEIFMFQLAEEKKTKQKLLCVSEKDICIKYYD